MSNRVLWFFFGDVTYWSFEIDEEEMLAGTLWSGTDTQVALQNFEAWLETFLDINQPQMVGLGIDRTVSGFRKDNCEACYAVVQLQADKYEIQTFDVDLDVSAPSSVTAISLANKPTSSPS